MAAGRGERLGAVRPKALVELAGKPLLAHVLDVFAATGSFAELVVVGPSTDLEACRALLPDDLPAVVVPGGERRQDSVRLGLAELSAAVGIVAVHDAARPLVSPELVRRTLEAARRYGAAIAAVPATDTVKEVDAGGRIVGDAPRQRLWLAQTPQAFRTEFLREAHERALRDRFEGTDDAALVSRLGKEVRVVPGEASNLKITRAEDLRVAEAILSRTLRSS